MTNLPRAEAFTERQVISPEAEADRETYLSALQDIGAIITAKDEPLFVQQPTDRALVAFTLLITFAMGWMLIAGPALMGWVLGIGGVGLGVWEGLRLCRGWP